MPKINLRPVSPGAGQLALSIHAQLGSNEAGDLRTGRIAYLDWFFENDSPFPTENEFESHVYVDGVFVSKWISSQAPPFQTFGVRDWAELNDRVRLDRGDHVFKVIIDALDQIPESDESDNVFERTFTWGGEPLVFLDPAARSVNLVIAPAMEGSEAVVIAATAGSETTGPVTVDATSFITWSAKNAGLASTDTSIAVHVYFDGLLVDQRVVNGISALSISELVDWDELDGIVRITPGEHTLTIVVDPGNLVDESDETDNTVTTTLTWGTGPAVVPKPSLEPTPIPPPPFAALTRPNLVTYLPLDWDAPLVVRGSTSGTSVEGRNGHVSAFTEGIVDYAITNSSPVANLSAFNARLLLDDVLVEDKRFGAGNIGGIWLLNLTIPASRLTPGTHTLDLVIDIDGGVAESDEIDNSFRSVFEVVAGPEPAPAAATTYSDAEISTMLATIPEMMLEILNVDDSDLAPRDWIPDILMAADAGYFLAVGTAIRDERLSIEFYPRPDYEIQLVETCLGDTGPMTVSEHALELARCRVLADTSVGVQTHRDGRIVILLDTSHTPAAVLNTLFHELGHARQELIAPTNGAVNNDSLSAIKEAQAQVFEAVGFRHIEEFLDASVTSYPDLFVLRAKVQSLIDIKLDGANDGENHDLGYILMWLTALQDPGGLGFARELRDLGKLSPASALAFYNYLLAIEPGEAQSWVASRMTDTASPLAEFEAITLGRFVIGLPPSSEGHPDLHKVAFLAP